MRFHCTRHFYQRLEERDLSYQSCQDAINYPDSHEHIPGKPLHKGKIKRFKKTVDGKTLVVIAEIKRTEAWLVTAYYL